MADNTIRLPYTAQEIQSLLGKIDDYDLSWTKTNAYLVTQGLSGEEGTDRNFDITSYVPQDGYLYEVLGHLDADSGKAYCGICRQLKDLSFDYSGSCVKTKNENGSAAMSMIRTEVATTLRVHFWGASQNIRINLHGYRRVCRLQASS